MKKLVFIITFILAFLTVKGLTFTDSNLPIIIITTDQNLSTGYPYEIPDDTKVLGTMKVIFHSDGTRNYISDQNNTNYLNYNGRIGIETRGSTSQMLPKKPYSLTTYKSDNITNNNVSILGMPKENDWALNSLAYDPSLIRDFLSYDLYRNMGNYSARGIYCEVVVNGDYKGLYIFMEKLKIDENRIDILKLTPTDITNPTLTGGYITKCDKTTGGDPVAWTMVTAMSRYVDFIHENPKPAEITSQQNTYIKNQFASFQTTTSAQNASIINGYPTIIDVPSFVDFMLMNELGSNPDGYHLSTFFHKDRNGKLRAGPIWDFNLTFGNDLFTFGLDRSKTNVWQFYDGGNDGAKFWNDLFNNVTYKCYLSKRWLELTSTNQPLNFTIISNRIDQLATLTSEAAVREQLRWSTISTRLSNISTLKNWIQARQTWINARLNNALTCSNLVQPSLVISKIHYNPSDFGTILSDSLEFVEITNNSNQTVNLSGIYFTKLGFTYQFPANSSLIANQKIYLAANSKSCELAYNIKPFGQYTRNLSNKSQKLQLADAFGNEIDLVEYTDTEPWPTDADGIGSYLELINLNADNSLGLNWIASNKILGVPNLSFLNSIKTYPNPVRSIVNIYCNGLTIKSYEITDLMGRIVQYENNFSTQDYVINIENLSSNIYLLKLKFENGFIAIKKIVKE